MMEKDLVYHTGYIGNLKRIPYRDMVFNKPEILILNSVSKMLPKNSLRFKRLKNIFIFRDQEHHWPSFLPKVDFS